MGACGCEISFDISDINPLSVMTPHLRSTHRLLRQACYRVSAANKVTFRKLQSRREKTERQSVVIFADDVLDPVRDNRLALHGGSVTHSPEEESRSGDLEVSVTIY